MGKAARELTVVALIIAAIAIATATARLLSDLVDRPHSRVSATSARN